ncbi:MAG: type II toxin-antitoxin system HicB family antitoxin [Mangrovibacterium sp.]|nr:type II toxin-antitoxin system HicB family antitoxin [Mangrovibacterium sp.]
MKKILVVIEKGTDGRYSTYTPDTISTVLNGQGDTVEEAIEDMKASIEEVIEAYLEIEEKVPDEMQDFTNLAGN